MYPLIEPIVPSEASLENTDLLERVHDFSQKASRLGAQLAEKTQNRIVEHMAVINSYYSNLIEGNKTLPKEIREAQKGNFAKDPVKRNYQLESLAHIEVQKHLRSQMQTEAAYEVNFIQKAHKIFFEHLPEDFKYLEIPGSEEKLPIVPGEFRTRDVEVGELVPVESTEVPRAMGEFEKAYSRGYLQGDKRILASFCQHHRFLWIHPFLDGNGRVARLMLDHELSRFLGGYGLWCMSRGLARRNDDYKNYLSLADHNRKGERDGRGNLSEKNLISYLDFMLEVAVDQVDYMASLLDFRGLKDRIRGFLYAREEGRVLGYPALKKEAGTLLYQLFLHGELPREEVYEVLNMPEATGRRLIKQLKDEGLITEESSRSPLSFAIPEHVEAYYLPGLFSGV